MVCPASVTTEGACDLVGVGEEVVELDMEDDGAILELCELFELSKLFTFVSVPVNETDQASGPPPKVNESVG